jgi:hypothetical protein
MADRLYCNRSRNCHLCGGSRIREQRSSPKPDDPHYVVAVCPTCDLTPETTVPTWEQKHPPASS